MQRQYSLFNLLSFSLLLLSSPAVWSKIDAMQLRLLESYQQALRWDNIITAPQWVNGVKPIYDRQQKMHLVILHPNNEVSFRLPPYQSVRLYSPYKKITRKDIKLMLSDGSGLAMEQTVYESTNGNSLILSPQSAKPLLIHLKSINSTQFLTLGLFVSRTVNLGEIAPYRTLIPISKNWTLLTQEAYQIPTLYWQVPANKAHTIQFKGNAQRIVLRHRLQYEPQAWDLIQDYQIRYQLDEHPLTRLNLSTSVETTDKITVNFQTAVVGRKEEVYIEIPKGEHRLTFSSDRMLYMQILAQTENDYLFANLNQPRQPVQSIREQQLLKNQPQELAAHNSLQTVRDNRHKEVAMRAIQALKQTALQQRPDYQPMLREAEKLRGFRSFYRNILPNHKAQSSPHFSGYFMTKKLQRVSRPQAQPHVNSQHLQALLKRLGHSIFTTLTLTGKKNAHEYYLPNFSTTTELRLIVDKRNCHDKQGIFVQFDQQKARALSLRCNEQNIKPSVFLDTVFEVAVNHYQPLKQDDPYHLIAHHFQDSELMDVAHIDLTPPQKIKQIKIWLADDSNSSVSIALQYRSDKVFDFSEQSYLARLREVNPNRLLTLFKKNLRALQADDPPLSAEEQQLKNQWQPLIHLIHAQANLYKSSVAKAQPENKQKISDQRLAHFYLLAKQAEKQQQETDALDYWAKIVQASEGLERHQAQFAQAQILNRLGESYLEERLLRYLFWYAVPSVAEQASETLRLKYDAVQDSFRLQMLAASQVLKNPNPTNLGFLIDVLVDNGDYHWALLLGLSLMPNPPVETLLQAAYQLKWWQSYDRLITQLADTEQDFWRGLKAQANGDYTQALTLWDQHAPRWSESLLTGLKLREKMTSSCGKQSAESYQQWFRWQQQQPSIKHWQTVIEPVKDYAGADSYYSLERDVYSQGFRGTAERPIKLSLLGPAHLRFKMRPLHPLNHQESTLNGWIEIKDNQQHQQFPFTNNLPSQGLALISGKELQLGGLITLDYQLGDGWHEIEVFSKQTALSMRLEKAQAQMPITVLPPLSPYNFIASWSLPQWPMLTLNNQHLVKRRPRAGLHKNRQHCGRTAHSSAIHRHAKYCQTLPALSKIKEIPQPCLLTKTTDEIIALLKKLPRTASIAPMIQVENKTVSTILLNQQPVITTVEQAQHIMMQFLRLIEDQAKDSELLLFHAEKLRLGYLDDPLVQSLWQRIARYTEWQPIESVIANAGKNFVEIKGWQPESPFIRTRKALLPPIADNEHRQYEPQVIFSDQRLVFITQQPSPLSLSIKAFLHDVPFLPEADAQLYFSIDEQLPQVIHLTREQSTRDLTVNLPAGKHSLRFYQRQALGNHYLSIRFDKPISLLTGHQQRGYFLSTHNEPVQIEVLGPTRLRIDEWREGRSTTHYMTLDSDGWQTLSLPPAKGKKERLIRLKQRRLAVQEKTINNRIVQRFIKKIPITEITTQYPADDSKINKIKDVYLHDAFKLGQQQQGTWALGVDWVRRNTVQEDSEIKKPEQFAEYHLEHYDYLPYSRRYQKIKGLVRVHELGGPTLGINVSQLFLPASLPFSVSLHSKLIGQWVHNEFEWLGEMRVNLSKSYSLLPKTRLIPSVSLFARHLSLTNNVRLKDTLFQQRVDQDIYSPYKADHPTGLNTALLLTHRPWLDTFWTAKLKIGSNAGFNLFKLDYIRSEFHWKQLLGSIKADASYRVTYYQKDNDRIHSTQRSQFNLQLDWNHWLWHQQRFQISTKYTYDIENQENLFMLSLTAYLSEGRGYRDFKPSSLDFKHLMQRQIPDKENNTLDYRN